VKEVALAIVLFFCGLVLLGIPTVYVSLLVYSYFRGLNNLKLYHIIKLYRIIRAGRILSVGLIGGWFIGLFAAIQYYGDISDPLHQTVFIAFFMTVAVSLLLAERLISNLMCNLCPVREECLWLREEVGQCSSRY